MPTAAVAFFYAHSLGFGAGQIGGDQIDDREAERLLGDVVDRGVTLIDTARTSSLGELSENVTCGATTGANAGGDPDAVVGVAT